MPRVFITYRRADSSAEAGRLHDHLTEALGRRNVFKDVDSIEAGEDFERRVKDSVSLSDYVLVVIGPQWLSIKDEKGLRRLDLDDDFVRFEIVTALNSGKKVVPILIGDTRMPLAADLPDPLRPLVTLHALRLRPDPDFRNDVIRLLDSIDRHSRHYKTTLQTVMIILAVATVAAFSYQSLHRRKGNAVAQMHHAVKDVIADFEFSRAVTPEMKPLWEILRQRAQASLDTNDRARQVEEGFEFSAAPQNDGATGLAACSVRLRPGSSIIRFLLEEAGKEGNPNKAGAVQLTTFAASVTITDTPIPEDIDQLKEEGINRLWFFQIVCDLDAKSQSIFLLFDFHRNRYAISCSDQLPSIVSNYNKAKTWEEFSDQTLLVQPLDGGGWNLGYMRLTEGSMQFGLGGNQITAHDKHSGESRSTRVFTARIPHIGAWAK